jgi:hypothetical protein
MAANVASDFTAASRVTNVDRIIEIERRYELSEIVRVSVHVISVPGLTRTPVTATIVSDAAISLVSQKEHLVFKGVS